MTNDTTTQAFLESRPLENLPAVQVSALPKKQLGKPRNRSVTDSHESYFCNLADEWYHAEKLSWQ